MFGRVAEQRAAATRILTGDRHVLHCTRCKGDRDRYLCFSHAMRRSVSMVNSATGSRDLPRLSVGCQPTIAMNAAKPITYARATCQPCLSHCPTDLVSGYMFEIATPADDPNQIIDPCRREQKRRFHIAALFRRAETCAPNALLHEPATEAQHSHNKRRPGREKRIRCGKLLDHRQV